MNRQKYGHKELFFVPFDFLSFSQKAGKTMFVFQRSVFLIKVQRGF